MRSDAIHVRHFAAVLYRKRLGYFGVMEVSYPMTEAVFLYLQAAIREDARNTGEDFLLRSVTP